MTTSSTTSDAASARAADAGSQSSAEECSYWFATCQVGAERALKHEIALRQPRARLAFSRPGFLTFKVPAEPGHAAEFEPPLVFARACGKSLGKASGDDDQQRAQIVWRLTPELPFEALHVWQRDTARPGFRGFEPHISELAQRVRASLLEQLPPSQSRLAAAAPQASQGQLVLDCVLVEPDHWWIGYHRASGESCHAGGIRPIELPRDAVSRAWLKTEEALRWSMLRVKPGERFVEIGCSPGGSSQALLARGLVVIGIDPANVDPVILANPKFHHVRKRGADVRRRELRGIPWLSADMNVAPQYTLDTVEAIVTHPATEFRGLLLTLKLLDWQLADELPQYLARIRGWGFDRIRARQLAHNRQEVCVFALRTRADSRPSNAGRQRSQAKSAD